MTTTLVQERAPKASPLQRLELLCDPGSLEPLRTGVVSTALGERARPLDDRQTFSESAHEASRQSTALCPPNPNAFEIPIGRTAPLGSGRASCGT